MTANIYMQQRLLNYFATSSKTIPYTLSSSGNSNQIYDNNIKHASENTKAVSNNLTP